MTGLKHAAGAASVFVMLAGVLVQPAFAKHGGGSHDNGRHEGRRPRASSVFVAPRIQHTVRSRHYYHDYDRDNDRDYDRDYDDSRPPGWSRGQKRGWRGHSLPPGLRKKRHHTGYYSVSPYYPPAPPSVPDLGDLGQILNRIPH